MKKKLIIAGIILLIIIVVIGAIVLPPTWSKRSFEAIIQETVLRPDGETSLIVQRTTKIYGDPKNALHISEDTKLIGIDGEVISVQDMQPGYSVQVSLKDTFDEETPFYYPTVYEIKVIEDND